MCVVCLSCRWGFGHVTAAVGAFAWYMTYCEVERGVLGAAKWEI